MRTKHVNEYFFNSEGKTPDELKAMWYIRGISISQYSTRSRQYATRLRQYATPVNRWQSTSEDLIGIVKLALESERAVTPVTNRNIRTGEEFLTYCLDIDSQKIYDDLANIGLDVPKEEKAFPKVKPQYLDHFVRGFFDAHVRGKLVGYTNKGSPDEDIYPQLKIYFNVTFLKGLYAALVKHAHVKGGREVEKSPLFFFGTNVQAACNFMYRDWDFITERGLYLPSRKAVYDANIAGWAPKQDPNKIAARQRIDKAKELLLRGMKAKEVAKLLGYSYLSGFYQAFKGVTGQTIGQFLRENGDALAA